MATKKKWVVLMAKVNALVREGQGSLYERVKLLTRIFDDEQFKDDMRRDGKRPSIVMNEKVKDTFTNFAELYAMLKEFPNKEQWADGDLPRMRDEMRGILKARENKGTENGSEPPSIPNGTDDKHSWKRECLGLREKCRLLEERCKALERENQNLRELLSGLSAQRLVS